MTMGTTKRTVPVRVGAGTGANLGGGCRGCGGGGGGGLLVLK